MANGIGQAHKLGKNRQQPGVTNYPSNENSSDSNSCDKSNKKMM